MYQHEEHEQIAVFNWAAYVAGQYPDLRWMYHTPNGGQRSKATAARLKAAGVKRGVPDICLPRPKHGYAGLYIEMKVEPNKPTKDQKEWLEYLAIVGYKTAVCYCADAAIKVILDYLEGRD